MKDLEGDDLYRRMVVSHKAFPDQYVGKFQISLGYDSTEGGTAGEFSIKWIDIGKLVPRLEVFDDGWAVLVDKFGDLLALLASLDNENVSPDELEAKIRGLGNIRDETEKYLRKARPPRRCPTCSREWPE